MRSTRKSRAWAPAASARPETRAPPTKPRRGRRQAFHRRRIHRAATIAPGARAGADQCGAEGGADRGLGRREVLPPGWLDEREGEDDGNVQERGKLREPAEAAEKSDREPEPRPVFEERDGGQHWHAEREEAEQDVRRDVH